MPEADLNLRLQVAMQESVLPFQIAVCAGAALVIALAACRPGNRSAVRWTQAFGLLDHQTQSLPESLHVRDEGGSISWTSEIQGTSYRVTQNCEGVWYS